MAQPEPLKPITVQTLSQEIQALDLPNSIVKPGWLLCAYLGVESNSPLPPKKLTKLLLDKFHHTPSSGISLSVDEILQILEETESIYPKYQA